MNSKKLPTLDELLSIEIPENVSVDNLREALAQINKHEVDKNVPIDDIIRYVSSLGIPSETPAKYLGIILLNWIEKLTLEHETEEGLAGNTGGDLEDKLEKYEDRLKQKKEIQDDSKKIIDAALKKKQSIQDELNKARTAESELKGKRLYVSVKVEEQTKLNEKEEAVITKLANDTIDTDKRTAEINKLSKEFEQQLSIKDDREREITAHAAIVGIIAQIHNPNLDHKINSEILNAVADSSSLSALIGDSDILELTKSGSIALSLNENAQQAMSRQAAIFLYGEKVAKYLFGPETVKVEVSNSPHSDSSHVVDLGRLNINHQVLLENQLQILEVVSQSDNPIATVYTRIISNTKDDELKIKTSKTKRVSDTERISELIKRTSPKNVSGDFSFRDIGVNTWVKDFLPQNSSIHTLTEKTTGQGLASTAVLLLTQQLGSKVTGNVATKGFLAKILPKLFGTGGPLAWLGAEAVSWIIQWLTKNKEKIPYIFAGIVGLGTLPFLGLGTALLVGGTTFMVVGGVGAASLLASSFLSGLSLFWRLIVLPPLKGFFIGFLSITILTVFVLFIINSGAYVVPPSPPLPSKLGADNPYMLVTKVANSLELDANSNQTVVYVVTIKALKGNLTNVNITDSECKVIKKDKSTIPCPTEVFPEITNEPISPNEPHSFSFTGIYDSRYSDALIYDSITFTATTEEGTEVTTSGSASVCIGDCPKGCLKIDNSWAGQQKLNIEDAITKIVSGYPGYIEKVCSTYDQNTGVILKYDSSGNGDYWGQNYGSYIKFYPEGVSTKNEALYTLAHELGHSLQNRFKGMEPAYHNWPKIKTEKPYCFYSATVNWNPDESLPEALGLFIAREDAVDHGCNPNFESKYPIHTEFLKTKIFN